MKPMNQKIAELSRLLSPEQQKQILEMIQTMLNSNNQPCHITDSNNTGASKPNCPYCPDGGSVKKYGSKSRHQRYKCFKCKHTFSDTTNTIMVNSHVSKSKWESVIRDTVNGLPIDHTAERLGLHHETVFNMRHKILRGIVKFLECDPIVLQEVAELDETYVLESFKGTKFDENSPRKPRLHGEKALKPGLSEEQICICAGVERKQGAAYAVSINRSAPNITEIKEAFDGRIGSGLIAFTDGAKSYSILEEENECAVEGVSIKDQKQRKVANLNNVNSFHAFIKKRYGNYRGVATKYLNRYNALFSTSFRSRDAMINRLCEALLYPSPIDYSSTIKDVENDDLFEV